MRVVCINDGKQYFDHLPKVKKGNMYTVINEFDYDGKRGIGGKYYVFVETGNSVAFHHSIFININEDQQDETEFERSELVKEMKS